MSRPLYVAKAPVAETEHEGDYYWTHVARPVAPHTPTFGLCMPVAASFVIPTLTVECFVLRDGANTAAHDGKTLRLSANLAGVPVRLRRAGDGYADSLDFPVALYGANGRSGFSQSLEFELTTADDGKTLTLSAELLTAGLTTTAISVADGTGHWDGVAAASLWEAGP